jgi:hypothetical protein
MTNKPAGQVELRDQLLAPAAIQDEEGEVVGCDIGALVRRLVLFETYILDTYAMCELPALIERIVPRASSTF